MRNQEAWVEEARWMGLGSKTYGLKNKRDWVKKQERSVEGARDGS